MISRLKRIVTWAAVVALSSSLAAPAWAQPAVGKTSALAKSANGIYIVQLVDDPVLSYKGGTKGLKATKPAKGKKIDPNDTDVVNYVNHLKGKQTSALAKVKADQMVHNYYFAFNGFAAKMDHEQALQLAALDGVKSVTADEKRSLDTASTPAFLGLDAPGGLWEQLGGVGDAGEDIIIGIVDGGIWPESLSFTDRTGSNGKGRKTDKLSYQQIPGWHGKCTPGEAFNASHCNQKLIGARYYNSGWGGNDGVDATLPWEFNSPRDFGGHGTHTASTAGGNNNVRMTGDAAFFGNVSGIAPRARIAAYKVCWQTPDGGSCFTSDSVAAIDQAVADGVDVINFSISGSRTNFLDPVEVAFLFAADAGVFVAASAGNSGPGASTVAHPGPWLTTVAASTHDRFYEAEVVLGNGATYLGASINEKGAGPAELVYSANVGLAGADPEEARLCYPETLDPALVAGKIVLCDRGVIARVDKSLAVYLAGGIGMIHANTGPSSLNGDLHSVPTVHVDHIDGSEIRDYANTDAAPTAEIFPGYFSPAPAPFIAGFSSRGPLLAGNGDLLKPDLSAPGVDILAAVAPPGNGGQDFASYQGTSMSSPHVAGLAALLKNLHPDWSPMMIKSALMTTGYDLLSGADPFAQGAGHVDPNRAADPGLVFDHGWIDWLGFLCGTGQLQASYCPAIGIDPSDLNVASIAIGSLAGVQTLTRTVTNVSDDSEYYEFAASVAGLSITANPASFSLDPGASQTVELTIANDGAALESYAKGSVSWTGDLGHVVRIPVAARPVKLAAPAELSSDATDGSLSFDITFGYDGAYSAATHGLEPATVQPGNVMDDPENDINAALASCDFNAPFPFPCTGITWHVVSVPAGTALTRISLFDEYTDGDDDLDLYVWDSGFSFVGDSGFGTSAEQVDILFPADTLYVVAVHGWQTDGPDSNYSLFDWSVSATPGGSLSLDSAPAAATSGSTESVEVSWAGLAGGMKYLGAVSHSDGGLIGLTVIRVETD